MIIIMQCILKMKGRILGENISEFRIARGVSIKKKNLINMNQLQMFRGRTGKSSASTGGNETIA